MCANVHEFSSPLSGIVHTTSMHFLPTDVKPNVVLKVGISGTESDRNRIFLEYLKIIERLWGNYC